MSRLAETEVGPGSRSAEAQGAVLPLVGAAGVPDAVRRVLDEVGYRLHDVATAADVAARYVREMPDVVLVDLAELENLEPVRALRDQGAVVVGIASHEQQESLDQALDAGLEDFVAADCDGRRIRTTLLRARRTRRLEREIARLGRVAADDQHPGELVGCSTAMRRLQGVIRRVAQSDVTALIEGKPGSGKSHVARLILASGRRSHGPTVIVDASSIGDGTMDELLREADGGSLLLEDVEELPAEAQATLVRHLKERGGSGERPDARVLATTGTRLPELVARGRFREDLYYRLNVFPVHVPSLQECRDDIALVARHFLLRSAEETGVPEQGFTPASMILLEAHPWPENAAQLQSTVYRAHALAGGGPIDRVHLLGPTTGLDFDIKELIGGRAGRNDDAEEELTEADIMPFEAEEKRLLSRALRATKGNVRRAAQLLKIGRATLYRKIQIYKLRLN